MYKEQLRAYNNEMEALDLEKRAALSSGSSASSGPPPSPYRYKEMKIDVWDGDYESMKRWQQQLKSQANVRGYLAQLNGTASKPDTAIQVELAEAIAASLQGDALGYLETAEESYVRLEEEERSWHAKHLVSCVCAAVRLRARGSLFRQVEDLLDPKNRCNAGDSVQVLKVTLAALIACFLIQPVF